MSNISTHRIILLMGFILIAGLTDTIFAQSYEDARKLAFSGERAKARQVCRAILAQGYNSDVALLLGRTYAWDGKYDSTRLILNEVLSRNPDNMEAIDAFADMEYWSENYSKAIEYCDLALTKKPNSEDFLFKKAKILHSSDQFSEALRVLEKLIIINPSHAEAIKKMQEYRLDVLKNAIQIAYTYDYFDKSFNRDPWQITAFSYRRKTQLGSVIARVNMANKFGNNGFQYEMDAYPKLSENNYGYVNYGFSQSSIFPKHRLGLEWYHNFQRSYEGSIGMRVLFFANSNVDIYTATAGKYIGNYWISLRSFVTPGATGTSVSGQLLTRRYFSDPENYLGLRIGYGISPDDSRRIIEENQELNLKSWSLRMEINHLFKHVWLLNTGATWGNEQLKPGTFSGDYSIDISIARLF